MLPDIVTRRPAPNAPKKPVPDTHDPRFVDIEGFDVTRRRGAFAYAASAAGLSALTYTFSVAAILQIAPPAPHSLSTLFCAAAGTVAGVGIQALLQRRALAKLPLLDEVALDRDGRHPQPQNMRHLYRELGAFKSRTAHIMQLHNLALMATGAMMMTGVGTAVTRAALLCVAGVLIPTAIGGIATMFRIRAVEEKRYTFCIPPNVQHNAAPALTPKVV